MKFFPFFKQPQPDSPNVIKFEKKEPQPFYCGTVALRMEEIKREEEMRQAVEWVPFRRYDLVDDDADEKGHSTSAPRPQRKRFRKRRSWFHRTPEEDVSDSSPTSDASTSFVLFDETMSEADLATPRYIPLARSIQLENNRKERIPYDALLQARLACGRKNRLIQSAVGEVYQMVWLLNHSQDFQNIWNNKIRDIYWRVYGIRGQELVMTEPPVYLEYALPYYRVDLHAPDFYRLAGAKDAYLKIAMRPHAEEADVALRNTDFFDQALQIKHYRITPHGTFLPYADEHAEKCDPIAEFLTMLRHTLGILGFSYGVMNALRKDEK